DDLARGRRWMTSPRAGNRGPAPRSTRTRGPPGAPPATSITIAPSREPSGQAAEPSREPSWRRHNLLVGRWDTVVRHKLLRELLQYRRGDDAAVQLLRAIQSDQHHEAWLLGRQNCNERANCQIGVI